jgi:polyisoprenoid-binding protein YceI
MKIVNTLSLTALLGFSSLYATQYTVDTGHTNIGFKVRHMMVASVRGTFKDYKGHYIYDPKTKHISSLEGTVKMASINTDDKKRDDHLRSDEFFDAKKYPDMTLKLIKHTGDKALIELTMKGITKQKTFEVEDLSTEVKDPWGNIKTGFSLIGKISRKAYNITFNKILETGGVAVGDEVKITLDIEGNKVVKKK